MNFAQELLAQVRPQVQALLQLHYQELTLHKNRIRLAPLWESYEALERAGQFVLYTARQQTALVGYAAFFVMPHLHYRDTLVAQNDVLFLHPEHRRGLVGARFIRFCEQALKAKGVHKLVWHVKYANDFRPVLRRQGYIDEEAMLGKMIQE